MKNIKSSYDVVIVGAGMIGLFQALSLAKANFSVLILDKQGIKDFNPGNDFELRVSAITPATEKLLEDVDVWHAISSARISPYRDMKVFGEDSAIYFSAAEINRTHLGHIIENTLIQSVLYEQLKTMPHVDCLIPAEMSELSIHDGVTLTTLEGQRIQAKMIIGADGANSLLRERLEIPLTTWAYEQSAIVATVHCEAAHHHTAWQQFLLTGPLAFLPLPSQHVCSIVWSCDTEFAGELMQLTDAEFNTSLTHYFQKRLGQTQVLSKRLCFPLTMRHAKQYVKPHAALIGDAAHTIHPLAGLGANLGFYDASVLTTVLINAREKDRPLGCYADLRQYERKRRSEVSASIILMETFKQLFGADHTAAKYIRNKGLNWTNRLPFLKNLCVKHAMGYNFT